MPPVLANVTTALASVTTYSLSLFVSEEEGAPAASATIFAIGLTSVMIPCRINSVSRRRHILRGRHVVSPSPPLLPPLLFPVTPANNEGINTALKPLYLLCISTHNMTTPGASASFILLFGPPLSSMAAATSSTYRERLSVLMGEEEEDSSLGVGKVPDLIFLTKAVHFLRSDFKLFFVFSNSTLSLCKALIPPPPLPTAVVSNCPLKLSCNFNPSTNPSNTDIPPVILTSY
mmetsp:Transcript_12766/g.27993  ORF Transcript_12766/g.27993 Transcript_12766/m.27993 type:complete len:232 (+) Transcript_12766:3424-4119(+)